MVETVARFRKKYTLTLLLFAGGMFHSFHFAWDAGNFITFATLLLSAFGAADLVDKKVANK